MGGELIVGRAQRVYPKPEPQLIAVPIPSELRASGISTQNLALKKVGRYYRTSSDWMWKLKLEELLIEGDYTLKDNLELVHAKLNLLLNQF